MPASDISKVSSMFFTQTPNMVCLTNIDGTIVYTNPAFERHTGHTAISQPALRLHDLISEESEALFSETFATVIGASEEIEVILSTPNGYLSVLLQIFPSVNDTFLAVGKSLEARKELPKAVIQAMQNSLQGFVVFEPVTNDTGEVIDFCVKGCNKKAEKILELDNLKGKHCSQHLHWSSESNLYKLFLQILSKQESCYETVPYFTPRQELLRLRIHAHLIAEPQQYIALSFDDVTIHYNSYYELVNLFEASSDLIVIMSKDGTIRDINRAFSELLGIEEKFLLQQNITEFIHREDRNELRSLLSYALAGQECRNVEMRCKRFNGSSRILHWRRVWHDSNLGVTYALAQNITDTKIKDVQIRRLLEESQRLNDELKDTIKELRETERVLNESVLRSENKHIELNTILNTVIDAIVTTDHLGNISTANKATVDLFGYTEAELLKMSIKDLLKRHSESDTRFFNSKNATSLAMMAQHKSGQELPVAISFKKGVLDDGSLVIVSVIRDLTDEQKANQELKSAKAQIENIFQSLDNIFWSLSVDKSHQLLTISDAVERVLGYPKSEWLEKGLMFGQISDPVSYQTFNSAVTLALKDGKAQCEFKAKQKDGKEKWLLADMRCVADEHGLPVRVDGILTNITVRKNAEISLASTQTMLQQILGALSDTIVFVNLERHILWVNKAAEQLFGYAEHELVGLPAKKIYANIEDYDNLSASIYNQDGNLHSLSYELLIKRKDNQTIWVEVFGKVVFNNEGERIGFLGVFRDITKTRDLEAESAKITSTLKEIKETLDLTEDAILICNNLVSPLKYANSGATRLMGYSEEQLKEKVFTDLFIEFKKNKIAFVLNSILKTHRQQNITEAELIHANGNRIPVELRLQYISDEKSSSRYIAIIRNITERKNAETKLKESELRFRSTFEQAALGIGHINLDFKTAHFNERFCEIIDNKEAHNNALPYLWKSIHQDYRRPLRHEFLKLINEETDGFSSDLLFITPKNKQKWVHLNASLVRDDKQIPVFVVAFFTDISAEKNAEFKLKNTLEELKTRNFELDQFVYRASHDLRAPLTSIAGIINVIRIETESSNFMSYVDKIENRVQKLYSFITMILNYSKSANSHLDLAEIDFEMLINETIEELKYINNASKIDIKVNIENPKGVAYYSDQFRIGIVLKNMMSNAMKYMNASRTYNFLIIKVDINPQKVFITISDNGIGIEDAHAARIFEMFYRASEMSDGSGLGLYIVKQTIKLLGGEIAFKSQLGQGTTFLIELPNFKSTGRVSVKPE